MPIPRRSYYQQNPPQSWSPSRPAYSHWSPPPWQESSSSQWQGWGSGWQYASQPWDTYREPWEKPRRQMRRQQRRPGRREGRKYQQTFVPPDARPIVTTSPAAAQAPEPVEPQLQITPPCPPTPRTINVRRYLRAEGINVSPPKRHKSSPRTPERKRKAAEQQEGSSPKKQKLTVWKPKLPQAETSKWPRMYTPLSQILYTPEHAVKNGVVAQDIGVRLCPSSLPKRGVSRNHSGSQLCS